MSFVHPVVRHLIICDNVWVDPQQPLKVGTLGLTSSIRLAKGRYPTRIPEFCVYAELTECRGTGKVALKIVRADTEAVMFAGKPRLIRFVGGPLDVAAIAYRVRNCPFSAPGLYWVQLWFDQSLLAQQSLLLR